MPEKQQEGYGSWSVGAQEQKKSITVKNTGREADLNKRPLNAAPVDKHSLMKRMINRQKTQWDNMQSQYMHSRFKDPQASAISIMDSNSRAQSRTFEAQKPGPKRSLETKKTTESLSKAKSKLTGAKLSFKLSPKRGTKRVELSNLDVNVEDLQVKNRYGSLQGKKPAE